MDLLRTHQTIILFHYGPRPNVDLGKDDSQSPSFESKRREGSTKHAREMESHPNNDLGQDDSDGVTNAQSNWKNQIICFEKGILKNRGKQRHVVTYCFK
ncbi:hypothetical protein VNO80_22677 [Phaseolus coccineus]|uniref:Uncharacterized protein n=1 Tax=Phaseolus coccineus TaxID=3886 RepID=A0AAN9MB13_PHACN